MALIGQIFWPLGSYTGRYPVGNFEIFGRFPTHYINLRKIYGRKTIMFFKMPETSEKDWKISIYSNFNLTFHRKVYYVDFFYVGLFAENISWIKSPFLLNAAEKITFSFHK